MNKKYNLNWISAYRSEVFGISILMIILFHFTENLLSAVKSGQTSLEAHSLIGKLLMDYHHFFGSIGVELFLFLSGVGLYYSFSRNSDVPSFYKRRFTRILIPYLIVAVPFWALRDLFLKPKGSLQFLKDLTFVTFFTDGTRTIWFIGLIVVLYIVFPVLYALLYAPMVEKNSHQEEVLPGVLVNGKSENRRIDPKSISMLRAAALIMAFILAEVLFNRMNPELYKNIEVAFTRIPLFILGVYMGRLIRDGVKLPALPVQLFILAGFVLNGYGRKWGSIQTRNVASLFSLALLLLMVYLLYLFRDLEPLRKVLRFFGDRSLELYLTHVTLRNLMEPYGFQRYNPRHYACMLILALLCTLAIHDLPKLWRETNK